MFHITALPRNVFAPLFALDDGALAARRARRVVADARPGFPCRVSLVDAAPGETVILAHYVHQRANTPFHASHAVYVREAAVEARLGPGEVPAMLRSRRLSLRGFDAAGDLRAAELADGGGVEVVIEALLADPTVDHVHIHFAAPGCYAAQARRWPASEGPSRG